MKGDEAIQVCHIVKRFGDQSILEDVTFSVRRGSITSLIGKSGSGKSLILKHIISLLKPDSGTVLVNGVDVASASRKTLSELRSQIGFLFQGSALFDGMTVFENIALPLRERKNADEEEIARRVREQARQLGVEKSLDLHPPELSGGMKKRVGLARALVTGPDIVLFDEPTTGLDPLRRNDVHSLIAESHRLFGFTALVVSHDIPEVFDISDSVVMIDQGRVAMSGSPLDFLRSPLPVVSNFLEGTRGDRDTSAGLMVRSEFEKRLREEYARAIRYGKRFCLVTLGMGAHDGEVHSRDQGAVDAAAMAGMLKECTRSSDLLARYDEESFILLLPHTSLEGADIMGRRLRSVLGSGLKHPDGTGPEIFFGMSEFDGEKSWEDMVRQSFSDMTNPPHVFASVTESKRMPLRPM